MKIFSKIVKLEFKFNNESVFMDPMNISSDKFIPNFFNSEDHPQLVEYVLGFLDTQDLVTCRSLNSRIHKIANNPLLYPKTVRKLKKNGELYKLKMYESNQLFSQKHKLLKEVKKLEINRKKLELESNRNGFKSFLLQVFSPNMYSTIYGEFQKKIENEINEIDEQLKKTEINVEEIRKKEKEISEESKDLCLKYSAQKLKYQMKTTFLKVQSLFGGESEYEKLPVLNIGNQLNDYIDFIRPEQMTAPIMRGCDDWNRPFFVIRAKSKIFNKTIVCQTFFQRYWDEASWADSHKGMPSIINLDDCTRWIIRTEINQVVFKELKGLITKGKNKNWVII